MPAVCNIPTISINYTAKRLTVSVRYILLITVARSYIASFIVKIYVNKYSL